MKTKNFDERQVQIRRQAYSHGFFTILILWFLNSILQDSGLNWASSSGQNTLIIVAAITIVVIEIILRGAFFKMNSIPMVSIFGFTILLIFLVWSAVDNFQGNVFWLENGILTGESVNLIFHIMFSTICIVAIIKAIFGLIKHKRTKD